MAKTNCPKCGRSIDTRGLAGHLTSCAGKALPQEVRQDLLGDLLVQLEGRYNALHADLAAKQDALDALQREEKQLSHAIEALKTARGAA